MAVFYRVIELDDTTWECRHGLKRFDVHETLDAALEHMRSLASDDRPSHVFIHRLNAAPVLTETFDED